MKKTVIPVLLLVMLMCLFSLTASAYEEKITQVDDTVTLHKSFEITFPVYEYGYSVSDYEQFSVSVWIYDDEKSEYIIVDDYASATRSRFSSNNGVLTKLVFSVSTEKSGDLYFKLKKGDKGVMNTNIIRVEEPGIISVFFSSLGAIFFQPLKMMIYTPLHHLTENGHMPLLFVEKDKADQLFDYLADNSGIIFLVIVGGIIGFAALFILKLLVFSKSKTYFAYFLNTVTSFTFIVMMAMRTNERYSLYTTEEGYDDYTVKRVIFWYTLLFVVSCIVIVCSMFAGKYGVFDVFGLIVSIVMMYVIFNFLGILVAIVYIISVIVGFLSDDTFLEIFVIMDYLAAETVDKWFGIYRDPYDGLF